MASGSTIVHATYASTGDAANDLKFSWWQTNPSAEYNTSLINWTLELIAYKYGHIDSSAQKTWSVTVNGTEYTGKNYIGISANSTKMLAQGSTPVAHNADGSKTFYYSFSQYFGISFNGSIGTKSGSGSGTLTAIGRASQPSLITYPENTQDVGEFGDTISVHMNRASSSFTHRVRYEFGDLSGTCIDADTGKEATAVGTGFKWKIPLALMNEIPKATSGSGRVYVDTYNGSTLVGTKYTGFTATVPASVKPTCTATLKDTEEIDEIYGSPVKGLSKILVQVQPTLAYGSLIKKYTITIDGVTYNQVGYAKQSGYLTRSGTSPVKVVVTDDRGRTGSWSYDMNVLTYNKPNVSKLTVVRCNQDGSKNAKGAYLKAVFTAKISSMSGKNTASYVLKYKKASEPSWESVTLSALSGNFAPTNYAHIFAAEEGTYDVAVEATDRHTTGSRSASAWGKFVLFNCHPSGSGIRFGGVAETENTLQNDLDLCQTGNSYAFQPSAFNGEKGYTLLAVITLDELNVNAPIVFVINRRGAICPMTVYARFASSSTSTDPDLASFTYEGDNYGAFMIKSGTSTWKLYVDNTGGWSNPCLQKWYTTDNQMARITVTFRDEQISSIPEPWYRAIPAKMKSILDFIYPVGSIYISYSHTSPETLFGGTWVRITNAFLWATDSSGTIGATGGEKEHTLTTAEMPSHTHGSVYSGNASGDKTLPWLSTSVLGSGDKLAYSTIATGGSTAHNNMPPYIQVSMWRRTE